MSTCEHANTRTIGYKDSQPDNYKKYYINRETAFKNNVPKFEVLICDDCGALLNDYEDGKTMSDKDITIWIDSLIAIRLNNIISFVEKIE